MPASHRRNPSSLAALPRAGKGDGSVHVNLRRSRLNGANPRGAHLQGADLSETLLRGTAARG
ncbi:MAG: pentapeptide repeat-containing protein [Desulfurellaceae bacterium]|nr:pentapeptide repeat-containing protein [Desulfurellaceae bacterium]